MTKNGYTRIPSTRVRPPARTVVQPWCNSRGRSARRLPLAGRRKRATPSCCRCRASLCRPCKQRTSLAVLCSPAPQAASGTRSPLLLAAPSIALRLPRCILQVQVHVLLEHVTRERLVGARLGVQPAGKEGRTSARGALLAACATPLGPGLQSSRCDTHTRAEMSVSSSMNA